MTIQEAVLFSGVGRSFLYEAMKRGELPYVKIGSARRIPKRALEEWLAKNVALSNRLDEPAIEGEQSVMGNPTPFWIIIKGRDKHESVKDAEHRIRAEFERQLARALAPPREKPEQPRFIRELSARSVDRLLRMGVHTDEDLYAIDLAEVKRRRGLGLKSLLEIANFVGERRDVTEELRRLLKPSEYAKAYEEYREVFPNCFA